jgi:VIT1/CCC1 family predicted Fe2+/Mn2+ transporter
MEAERQRFLGAPEPPAGDGDSTVVSALVVGTSYLAGAVVPVLPVLFGARSALPSLVTAGSVIIVVSTLLAFLSGMDVRRRILTNLVIIGAAVGVTYLIGTATKLLWGIAL